MDDYKSVCNKEHTNSLHKLMNQLKSPGKAEKEESREYVKDYMSPKPPKTKSAPDMKAKGGEVIKRAMGGVGKMRLGQADSKGNPIKGR